ncbi:hypothetical protein LOK49_LG01G01310 [Camellia lanceoleosa]|uniref:Uncharacterized protein n=1 Tax=Camellia lanceoleosa TaxID=1840588 RepID=A0ACC0J3M9_9ERIC|nr:hypothetical protein LOK49_LG01G01310 [Camellia lanceoleosa]
MASDDAPHDIVPLIIVSEGDLPSPVPRDDIPALVTDVEGHDEDIMAEDVDAAPELVLMRIRPFDHVAYKPRTHTMVQGECDALLSYPAADAFYILENYTAFLRSHIMPPLTKGVTRAIRVANAHATGGDALAGAISAARGLPPSASDVALSLGHPTLSTAVIFQTPNGVLDELPLESLGR